MNLAFLSQAAEFVGPPAPTLREIIRRAGVEPPSDLFIRRQREARERRREEGIARTEAKKQEKAPRLKNGALARGF
jgi:hypothetical protein